MTSMPNSHRVYANRRVTAASLDTHRTVASYQADHRTRSSISRPSRTQALQVAKRYASAIGLKAAKIALIDQLFAFSMAIDWSDAQTVPVVWPSNELLARRLGIKISTLKYHLAGLVEAGLICYSDHPTYQRRGRRSEDGRIAEAYGINLSPIAARYSELLDLADTADFEARKCKGLSNQRTLLRRGIAAIIEAARLELGSLSDEWNSVLARLDRLRERRGRGSVELADVVDALEALRAEAAELLEVLYDSRDFNTAVAKTRPLQTTAETRHSESCNGERNCADAQYIGEPSAIGAMAYEKSLRILRRQASEKRSQRCRMTTLSTFRCRCCARHWSICLRWCPRCSITGRCSALRVGFFADCVTSIPKSIRRPWRCLGRILRLSPWR
ncbi:hypothetical protein HB780_02005 (plasmid) [Rhizobium lusitanum]|nr:hypothetical protein HB780_02005 [Rhizobium lusitanum]